MANRRGKEAGLTRARVSVAPPAVNAGKPRISTAMSDDARYSRDMIGRNEEHYEIRNEAAAHNLLFLCDHAANAVPAELGTLGLSSEDFQAHIAYDIGAGHLTRALADRFAAP